jgi:type IV pilus assembly protein PilQ
MTPARPGAAQKAPSLPQVAKDPGLARLSPIDASEKPAKGASTAAGAVITGISMAKENGVVVVTVSANGPVDYKAFTLSEPRRLVVDFINAGINLPYRELSVDLANLKQIRVSEFDKEGSKTARLVLDLADVKRINHQITAEGSTIRILIPAQDSGAEAPAAEAPQQKKSAPAPKAQAPSAATPASPAQKQVSSPASPGLSKTPPTAKPSPAPATNNPAVKSAAVATTKTAESTPPAKSVSLEKPKPAAKAEPAAAPKAASSEKTAVAKKTEATPAKSAAASKPVAAPKPEGGESKSTPAPKPSPAAASKAPASVKPAAATKAEAPASQKPKPATTEAAGSGKVQSAGSTPAVPKPEAVKAPAASNAAQKPATPPSPTVPAKAPQQLKAELEPTSEHATTQPLRAAKETPPPNLGKSSAVEARPVEVAEAQSAGRFVAPKAAKVESAPAQQVHSAPPQPALSSALMQSQESRFGGTPLTLDLIDVPLVDFFRLMAEEGGINVVMDPQITGSITIKVVKVPWDQILEAALANNGLDKQVEGNLVRIAKKTTLQAEAKQREDLKKATLLAADVETKIKRLNYAKAATFVPALTEQKTVRGTVVVDERTNSLVITDIPGYLDKMLKLIESLDIPQAQVEIEARIVSANRDFARDLGVQFGFVQGNLQRVTLGGPNTFGTIGGTRPAATPTNTFAAGNSSTGRGASEGQSTASAGVSTGTSSQNAGNFNVNLPAGKAFGGLGLSVGNILDTFMLDAAITAGESKGLAKLISQPKVTAQNNSAATITQGLRFPVQIVANNTITVQFQNAALTLIVTPQITYEGNVVLDLHVENNTPDFSRAVNGIPSVRTSESTTRVLVTDGGTTVIGGIIIESDSNSSDRVPGAATLPLIGNLFKRTSVSRSTQEVLFFITPKVMK